MLYIQVDIDTSIRGLRKVKCLKNVYQPTSTRNIKKIFYSNHFHGHCVSIYIECVFL